MKIKHALALLALLLTWSAHASPVETVTIDGIFAGNSTLWWSVTFTGSVESNGDINEVDLSALQYQDDVGSGSVTLANLWGFGTFDTLDNSWSENGASAEGNIAYLSWNGGGHGLAPWDEASIGSVTVDAVTGNVPEPASIVLVGAGLVAALWNRNRKRSAR